MSLVTSNELAFAADRQMRQTATHRWTVVASSFDLTIAGHRGEVCIRPRFHMPEAGPFRRRFPLVVSLCNNQWFPWLSESFKASWCTFSSFRADTITSLTAFDLPLAFSAIPFGSCSRSIDIRASILLMYSSQV